MCLIPVQQAKLAHLQPHNTPGHKKQVLVRAVPQSSYKIENEKKQEEEEEEHEKRQEEGQLAEEDNNQQHVAAIDGDDDYEDNDDYEEEENEGKNEQPGPIRVDIKPARKTGKHYIKYFPEKLYCTPYKYDVRVRFNANESHVQYTGMLENGYEQSLTFKLLDGETRKTIKSNSKGEHALIVEKCKKNEVVSDTEDQQLEQHDVEENDSKRSQVIYRLCFTVCSFHNFRRPFVIQCSEKNSGLVLFESNPFHIFARKTNRDKQSDAWGSDPEPIEKLRTLFSGLENASCTPHPIAKQSPKRKRDEKEGDTEPEAKKSRASSQGLRIQLPPKFQQHTPSVAAETLTNLE